MSQANSARIPIRTSNLTETIRQLDGQTFRFRQAQSQVKPPQAAAETVSFPSAADPLAADDSSEVNIDEVGRSYEVERLSRLGRNNVDQHDDAEQRLSLDSAASMDAFEPVTAPPETAPVDDLQRQHQREIASGTVTTREAFLEQSRQLVRHLQAKELALCEQDSAHHVRVWNWERQVMQQQQEIEARRQAADQHEARLKSLQFELLDLQNELIDSQLATRSIVTELSFEGDNEEQLQALEALKGELTARFDAINQQWKRLFGQMPEPDAGDPAKRCA